MGSADPFAVQIVTNLMLGVTRLEAGDRAAFGKMCFLLAGFHGMSEAGRPTVTPGQHATGDHSSLLDRFIEAGRKKNFRVAVKPQRAAVDPPAIRSERARNLLAILLKHPVILPEIEESLAGIDLPEGHPETLRAALLAWFARADVLDSTLLLDQLASSRAGEAVTWALRGPGLAKEARPDAQPADALAAWWHFFALLRGEAELSEDCARAERLLAATNDPAAERRLKHLTEARLALRGGEIGLGTGADP